MNDLFERHTPGLESPVSGGAEVTPSDDDDLATVSRYLWVGTGGDVKVTLKDGATITITNIPDGQMLPVRVRRVWATNTTATGILALY